MPRTWPAIVTLTHLTKLFVADIVARRFGYMLLLASIGAYQPLPDLRNLLGRQELRALFRGGAALRAARQRRQRDGGLPGRHPTEFLEVAGQQPSLYQRTMMMESPEVTRIAIDALLSGKASVVPGFMNALLTASTRLMLRLMPRQLAAMSADRFMTVGNAWLGQHIAGWVFGNVAYDDPNPWVYKPPAPVCRKFCVKPSTAGRKWTVGSVGQSAGLSRRNPAGPRGHPVTAIQRLICGHVY